MTTRDNRRILVIDDDQSSRSLIARTLEPKGFAVHEVADPDDGVRKVREIMPDLIFINILFPGSNGLKVSKAIHSDEELHSIPIIMLISYKGELDPKYTTTIGIVDVLVKPLNAGSIIEKTMSVLGIEEFPAGSNGTASEISGGERAEPFLPEDEAGEALLEEAPAEDHEYVIEEEPAELLVSTGEEEASAEVERIEADYEEVAELEPVMAEESPDVEVEEQGLRESLLGKKGKVEEKSAGPDVSEDEPGEMQEDEKVSLIEKNLETKKSMTNKVALAAILIVILAVIGIAAFQIKARFFADSGRSVPTEVVKETLPGDTAVSVETPMEKIVEEAPAVESVAGVPGKEPVAEAPSAAARQDAGARLYSVQMGAFGNEQNAHALAEKLRRKGYDAFVEKDRNRQVSRVLIGRFDDSRKASEEASALSRREGVDSFVYRLQ